MKELTENRIINGVLKAGIPSAIDPAATASLLTRDLEIVVHPDRCQECDLWPSTWALAAVLSRQFRGRVFLNCGLASPLPAPAQLPSVCLFAPAPTVDTIRIGLGTMIDEGSGIYGDVRGDQISYGALCTTAERANPISGFALAGYLGFAALAEAVGIPPYRTDFACDRVNLPHAVESSIAALDGITLIGLGNIGQAYVALLWFLGVSDAGVPFYLIDKDAFEPPNLKTQILLDEATAVGVAKSDFLGEKLRSLGADVRSETVEIGWGWQRPQHHPGLVLIGVDNFDARRMILSAGYDWAVEAGIGDQFLKPKLTWHSLQPGSASVSVFPRLHQAAKAGTVSQELERLLRDTPGECGWFAFQGVSASAPCMGVAAAAYALGTFFSEAGPVRGHALLWSPLIPPLVERL